MNNSELEFTWNTSFRDGRTIKFFRDADHYQEKNSLIAIAMATVFQNLHANLTIWSTHLHSAWLSLILGWKRWKWHLLRNFPRFRSERENVGRLPLKEVQKFPHVFNFHKYMHFLEVGGQLNSHWAFSRDSRDVSCKIVHSASLLVV